MECHVTQYGFCFNLNYLRGTEILTLGKQGDDVYYSMRPCWGDRIITDDKAVYTPRYSDLVDLVIS